ncbi:hypothetical protein PHMEG_00037544 [Phytophthora megakarya]|uniref:Bzip transcription factor n=1 Tax=Phytophthora megakarya TaxID=4795 RepID=A0A225UJB9_9STRA|nr:hypothetical protein PHMEG_00037544 [Phytophthora megakarya]
MAPGVTDGTVSGVDGIMETWKSMSLCFPRLVIELTSLENGPSGSIIATTKHSQTISENMLHNAFPRLIHEGGESSQLVNKLLGGQIVIQATVHFEWDSDNSRVSSFVFKADLVTPMLRLLGNLEDVSYVFNNARLTPECRVVGGFGL